MLRDSETKTDPLLDPPGSEVKLPRLVSWLLLAELLEVGNGALEIIGDMYGCVECSTEAILLARRSSFSSLPLIGSRARIDLVRECRTVH